jgi:uridine kinase
MAKPFIVAIGGGSGSGKTTIANETASLLAGKNVIVLSEDNYYRDNGNTPGFDAETFNFDDIEARDHLLMQQHIHELRAGRGIDLPNYCFVNHRRKPETTPIPSADVIMIEGTHLLYPAQLRSSFDITVYIDVADDIRLARRMLRDLGERGRSPSSVVDQYLGTVRPMHYRFTHPARFTADLVLANEALGDQKPRPAAVIAAEITKRQSHTTT